MKLANQQLKGPKQPSIDLKIPKKEKEAEFDRPMTAKEKEEFIRERNSQLRKLGKIPKSVQESKRPESHSKPKDVKDESGPSTSVSKVKGPCKENGFKQVLAGMFSTLAPQIHTFAVLPDVLNLFDNTLQTMYIFSCFRWETETRYSRR